MNNNWANNEFKSVDLGDQRLNKRLVKLSEDFIKSPESPINQSSGDWAATKAAYRFFQNESISYKDIIHSHAAAAINRCEEYASILTIQDTTYFTYSNHPKTAGLCNLTNNKGKHNKNISTDGLIMHTVFAVSPDGLPLGIVDQKIYSRPEVSKEKKEIKDRTHNKALPIEEKDSYRWIESLDKTHSAFKNINVNPITICDRECDIFDFFHLASKLDTKVLIRASHNRKINKSSTYSEKTGEKLWTHMQNQSTKGSIQFKIPAQDNQPERIAKCEITFDKLTLSPPHNHPKMKELSPLSINAIYLSEVECPENISPIDWILLTNIAVETFDEALEKIRWYCLRWRIEIFHKVLKSGLKVEDCRLETADRLIRYLSVMSIVAWRIYWLTLVSRIASNALCSIILNEDEWRILYAFYNKNKPFPKRPPTINQCVRWIAMLGGFLARKHDKEPGIINMWRGLKKFSSILEGAEIARGIYG